MQKLIYILNFISFCEILNITYSHFLFNSFQVKHQGSSGDRSKRFLRVSNTLCPHYRTCFTTFYCIHIKPIGQYHLYISEFINFCFRCAKSFFLSLWYKYFASKLTWLAITTIAINCNNSIITYPKYNHKNLKI